jgi:uncharacterized membrane protein
MFDKHSVKKLLSENCSLLIILIGIVLVSVSIGPFQNGDTQWEYEAASGVIRWGMPYVISFGNMMDQPPLGFYLEALFFKVFGLSMDTGVILVMLLGLGCTVIVYEIGKVLYSKTTGLLAAVLFALAPWEVVFSRSFLIDVQCLFFSLLYLFVGISAFRKNSLKLFMVSGIIFAIALLTKFYAIFTLIPLILFYVYYQPKNLRRIISWLGIFFLPVLLFAFLWYQVISGQGLLSIFYHGDFGNYGSTEVVPSFFFVFNFLANFGLGWFFIDAVILSLLVSCFLCRKRFSQILVFDLFCLVTLVSIVSVNIFLGFGFNLKAPYLNAFKYSYQSLPFFSLLAASLVGKCFSLFNSLESSGKLKKLLFFFVVLGGLDLVVASIFFNMYYVHQFSTWDYLLFRVEKGVNAGYSFFNTTPIGGGSFLMGVQYLGFGFVLSGLLLGINHELGCLLKLMHHFIGSRVNMITAKMQACASRIRRNKRIN